MSVFSSFLATLRDCGPVMGHYGVGSSVGQNGPVQKSAVCTIATTAPRHNCSIDVPTDGPLHDAHRSIFQSVATFPAVRVCDASSVMHQGSHAGCEASNPAHLI